MSTAYIFWTSVVVGGAIAGVFLRPRTIGILGGSLFVLCILGLVVSALIGGAALAWVFGIGAMIVPPVVVVAFVAGSIVHALLRAARSASAKQRSVEPDDS